MCACERQNIFKSIWTQPKRKNSLHIYAAYMHLRYPREGSFVNRLVPTGTLENAFVISKLYSCVLHSQSLNAMEILFGIHRSVRDNFPEEI